MKRNKLDLHTLTIALMSLNGWGLLKKEHNETFFHRLVANNMFASPEKYIATEFEVINTIHQTFDNPALRCVHTDIAIDDVF